MAQQDVYPSATTLNEWSLTGAATAHQATDEIYPPGNETDYATVGGFTGANVLRLVFEDPVPETMIKVTEFQVTLNMKSSTIDNVPALQVRLLVAGGVVGLLESSTDTGDEWLPATFTFRNLNIIASTWEAGPVEISLIPINGSAGYSPSE